MTAPEVPAPAGSPSRPRADVLQRADGIELIGEFEDSGFKDPPLLARRADGQVVQLTELLYAVAEESDGQLDVDGVADRVSERVDRPVNGDNVRVLADKKLRPLGVLAQPDGTTPELEKREPLMALRHRKPLLSERVVNGGARAFTWLHLPLVTVTLLLAVVAFDVWLFGLHGIAGGLRSAIYNPTLLLAVLASVVVATIFHEFGHASACRYGGARPGVMGVGLYLVWPAFYCDVTDAYRLNRRGRLRTDLGGVYFNAIFALLLGGVFFLTGEEAALLAAFLMHVIMAQQLLPLLRFDGYYVLTDLTGVPDILSRIKPIFRSLVRGRRREPQVAELKPWVRLVVTAYLLTLIPTLAFLFAWMTMGFPRLLATVYDSLGLQIDRLLTSPGPAEAGVGVVRLLMLVLPAAAMSLSLGRTTKMAGRGLNRWSSGSLPRRIVATAVAATLIGAVGYIWWPNGDYQPIRPGERGTIGEAVGALKEAPGGRPAFTPERELMYAHVATEREEEAALREGPAEERPAGHELFDDENRPIEPATPGGALPGTDAGPVEGSPGLGSDGMPWPGSSGEDGTGYATGGGGSYPSSPGGTATTQPGTTAPTQPPPSTTTTAPPPSDGGTTTAPGDTTAPTTTESTPPPSDTTAPTTTETTPPPTDTTTTAPAPEATAPMTTESIPTAPDTTTTAPDTTTTTPLP